MLTTTMVTKKPKVEFDIIENMCCEAAVGMMILSSSR